MGRSFWNEGNGTCSQARGGFKLLVCNVRKQRVRRRRAIKRIITGLVIPTTYEGTGAT